MVHPIKQLPLAASGLGLLVFAAALAMPARATADLNGHWNFDFGPVDGVTDISEIGSTVSFILTNGSVSASFSGTRTGNSLVVTAPPPSPSDCTLQITATIGPGDNSISGDLYTVFPCGTPGFAPIRFERCGCFDGNDDDGDGCDALCRVETCYSCTGEPSVCVPQGDGTPCDDLAACTSGETCTGLVCGGGSPVSPCIDASGSWRLRYDFYEDFISDSEGPAVFTQRNTSLEVGGQSGTIDPLSGGFQVNGDSQSGGFCPGDSLSGQISADNRSLTGSFTTYVMTSTQCPGFSALVTGSRCGGGTLDAGEECDDGNWTDGDGCTANCTVETCYACTSASPSICSPLTGTECDDGNGCTLSDTCQVGTCTGAPVSCGPCLTCSGAAQCVAAPRTGCLHSTEPSQSRLFIRDSGVDDRDAIAWHWRRGEQTAAMALGDPTQSTAYDLCIYDDSLPQPTLVFAGRAPAGCPSAGCWTPRSRGFTYRSSTGAADGLTRIELRAHNDGRSRVIVKGTGTFLTHQYGVPTAPLALPLRVQLQAVDAVAPVAACFEAGIYIAGVSQNDDGVFRARATQ